MTYVSSVPAVLLQKVDYVSTKPSSCLNVKKRKGNKLADSVDVWKDCYDNYVQERNNLR